MDIYDLSKTPGQARRMTRMSIKLREALHLDVDPEGEWVAVMGEEEIIGAGATMEEAICEAESQVAQWEAAGELSHSHR